MGSQIEMLKSYTTQNEKKLVGGIFLTHAHIGHNIFRKGDHECQKHPPICHAKNERISKQKWPLGPIGKQ